MLNMPSFLHLFVRRKHYRLSKCVPVLGLLFVFILFLESHYVNFEDSQAAIGYYAKHNIVQIVNTADSHNCKNWTRQVYDVRRKVYQENWNEFLDELLKELNFVEVDLTCINTRHEPENDTSIQVNMDKIGPALDRSLPDFREIQCKVIYNYGQLPSLSVIIAFVNEPFCLVARTVQSIFKRTPETILREVVLVDGSSDHSVMHDKLPRYLATRFPSEKIRLIRLSKRSGIVKARMIGAHVAVGDVLMFLDAHCEVTNYWAEPLLRRIKEKRTVVVSPIIDEINRLNFMYNYNTDIRVGDFRWSMTFDWSQVHNNRGGRKTESNFSPLKTPVISRGLFGIDRNYFWEIGSFDPGMLIWGSENMEMSFRIWQCGGSIEIIPCSRIGHVFRIARPNSQSARTPVKENTFQLNTARMAEVWMDEYKELYYTYSPRLNTFSEKLVNISSRQSFRKRKGCKSFKWYLDNVHPEKFKMQFDSKLYGQLKNKATNVCLDHKGHDDKFEFPLETYSCYGNLFPSQTFFFSNKDELRLENACATTDSLERVKMIPCANLKKDDLWFYRNGQVYSVRGNKCLTLIANSKNKKFLKMSAEVDGRSPRYIAVLKLCDKNDLRQQWEILTYNKTKVSVNLKKTQIDEK